MYGVHHGAVIWLHCASASDEATAGFRYICNRYDWGQLSLGARYVRGKLSRGQALYGASCLWDQMRVLVKCFGVGFDGATQLTTPPLLKRIWP